MLNAHLVFSNLSRAYFTSLFLLNSEIIKESMRDSKNFKAHLKMCKNYMGSTIQYDLELQYSPQLVQNTDIHVNAQVSKYMKKLIVRYALALPERVQVRIIVQKNLNVKFYEAITYFGSPKYR